MTYLDYQATTPLAPEALAAMLPWLEHGHANPHSPHAAGRAAKAAVEVARERVAALLPAGGSVTFTGGATEALNWAIKGVGPGRVAALLPAGGSVTFTGGATEALNWAIKGVGPGRVVTIATEHAAVLETAQVGGDAVVLPVGRDGLVDLDAAQAAIVPGTALVAAMLVNNEIGVVQPVAALAELAHAAGALFLCDAVQGYGRVPVPEGADLIAVSAHKVHGPKGIGALWIRDGVTLAPLLHGGGQEGAGRSGTLSPALCAGFGAAAALAAERAEADAAHVSALFDRARAVLGEGWIVNGSVEARYRGNLNIRRPGLDVARLMSGLRDVAFSAGSACASGSGRSSHVLRALGLAEAEARSSIRLGFGRYTTEAELVAALRRIDAAAREQRIAA